VRCVDWSLDSNLAWKKTAKRRKTAIALKKRMGEAWPVELTNKTIMNTVSETMATVTEAVLRKTPSKWPLPKELSTEKNFAVISTLDNVQYDPIKDLYREGPVRQMLYSALLYRQPRSHL
jgi:hypothetical protein